MILNRNSHIVLSVTLTCWILIVWNTVVWWQIIPWWVIVPAALIGLTQSLDHFIMAPLTVIVALMLLLFSPNCSGAPSGQKPFDRPWLTRSLPEASPFASPVLTERIGRKAGG